MLELTMGNFKEEVINATEPVLVDFWAAWCRPCHALASGLQRVSENVVKAKVGKVNVDEQPFLSTEYKIQALPTLIFFKNGQEVNRLVGLQNESVIQNTLEGLLND